MTLLEKQMAFAVLEARLTLQAVSMGYGVTDGECWRSDETALAYAKTGKGISNSLHRLRLAKDINLFKNGIWLRDTEDHRPLGEWWKSQSTPELICCWGGDFLPKPDGNHYSVLHNGVR